MTDPRRLTEQRLREIRERADDPRKWAVISSATPETVSALVDHIAAQDDDKAVLYGQLQQARTTADDQARQLAEARKLVKQASENLLGARSWLGAYGAGGNDG